MTHELVLQSRQHKKDQRTHHLFFLRLNVCLEDLCLYVDPETKSSKTNSSVLLATVRPISQSKNLRFFYMLPPNFYTQKAHMAISRVHTTYSLYSLYTRLAIISKISTINVCLTKSLRQKRVDSKSKKTKRTRSFVAVHLNNGAISLGDSETYYRSSIS